MKTIQSLLALGRFEEVPAQFEPMTRLWEGVKHVLTAFATLSCGDTVGGSFDTTVECGAEAL